MTTLNQAIRKANNIFAITYMGEGESHSVKISKKAARVLAGTWLHDEFFDGGDAVYDTNGSTVAWDDGLGNLYLGT